MFASPRRPDDADVIRARLRVLLDEGTRFPGWVPEEEDPTFVATVSRPSPDGPAGADVLPYRPPGEADRADAGWPRRERAEDGQVEPGRAEPDRAARERPEPDRAEREQAEPGRAEREQAGTGRAERDRTGHERAGGDLSHRATVAARAPLPVGPEAARTVPVDAVSLPPPIPSRQVTGRRPDGADRWSAVLGRHRAPGPVTRLVPGRRSAWSLWAVALAAALAVAGWSWLQRPEVQPVPTTGQSASTAITSPPVATAATPLATDSPPPAVVVSVVGQVRAPGLVTLPAGSRVADALTAAGGLLPGADPAALNAAALVVDGQQIAVGVPGAAFPAAGAVPASGPPALVDLNTASVADLDTLPGVGPVLAQRIVDHRAQQGPFTSVEQLQDVDGIGPAIYARLSVLVRV